jgi:hypothetical protein
MGEPMRISVASILLLLLSGCASTYKNAPLAEPSAKLVSGKSVFIATSANGFYESKEYQNSGKMTTLAVRAAFARFATSTTVSADCKDLPCLERTQGQNYDYYVVPEILHWEDRATEWSGIPDRLEVKISVFDPTKKEIASSIISGKSKWLTFGGDHPQDLLSEPVNEYVGSLY